MSFKRDSISIGLTQGILFFCALIMSILNARLLGPAGVGIFALLRLMQNLSIRVSDLGFGRSIRYYSAKKEFSFTQLRRIVISLSLIVGLVVILIDLGLKFLPIKVWDDIDVNIYLLFLPTTFFYVLISYARHLLHGDLQIKLINITEVIERTLYIALFILFVWKLKMGLLGAVLSLSCSTLIIFVFLIYRLYSNPKRNSIKKEKNASSQFIVKNLWKYGRWSYLGGIISYLNMNLPLVLLKSISGSFTDIGYFTKAQGLSNYPRILAIPLSGLLFSYNVSSTNTQSNSRTEIVCRLSFGVITCLYCIIALFIKPLIILLYGAEFLPAAKVFYLLYPSMVIYVQELFLSSSIAAKGAIKEVFIIGIKSLPFIILITYFLVKYYGIYGAAMAFNICYLIRWVQFARKYNKINNTTALDLIVMKKSDFNLIKVYFLDSIKKRKESN